MAGGSVHAQSAELETVVVTATRTVVSMSDLLADVSVIDAETIARSGAVSLVDVLVHVPGVEMVRNGGPAATTSLYLRGGHTNHTVVMIDGVRVDTQSGSGGANWQAIPASQIDRIEVLRGPAAAVYGSDAVAGVIQVFTQVGRGDSTPTLGWSLGTHGTRSATAGLQGAGEGGRYALSVGRQTSDGFNARTDGYADKDGYGRDTASLRLGWNVAANHSLEASWSYSDTDAGYDSTASQTSANYAKDNRTLQKLSALGLNWQARWSDVWSTRVTLTQARDRYATLPAPGAAPSYATETQVRTALWHNTFHWRDAVWTAALERRQDELVNASMTPRVTTRSQDALALGYGGKAGVHNWQVNVRLDDDSAFGHHATGAMGYGLALSPAWRLTASAASAFRAPTLYQRFSEYGVAELQPERARNTEWGLKYAAQGHAFSAVAYRNRITNLITYVGGAGACASAWGCYVNTARTTLQGATVSGAIHTANVVWTASLDLQDPVDAITGKRLARRVRKILKLGVETEWQAWSLQADALLSGDRFDDPANTDRLPGYGLLSLSASRDLTPQWRLRLRLDNVGDKSYETARGYATPGRTVFVGLNWTGR